MAGTHFPTFCDPDGLPMTDDTRDDPAATRMAVPALNARPAAPDAPASDEKPDDSVRLLTAVAAGDAAAFETLYRFWSPTLMGIALRILPDRSEAEECLQDAFVRIWRKAADFDPVRGAAFAWAFGILRGLCLDRLRYRSRLKRGGPLSPISASPAGGTDEPSEPPRVVAADDLRRVREMLDSLDPPERECLQLAVLLEYSHTEIADRLRTPLGTVKNRLRRALGKLRTLFRSHES